MLRIDVIAAGKIKSGPFLDLWNTYKTRLPWKINLFEIEGKSTADEHKRILEKLDRRAYIFALDEAGRAAPSIKFADQLQKLASEGRSHLQFVIGGADGLSPEVRKKADYVLSFGVQTWPHKLVRVMLIEQLYRACQIMAGHPYHRE